MSESIQLTDSAAKKILELATDEGNLELKLRVYVMGGGCSGFQYGFSFEEEPEADDVFIIKLIDKNKVTVIIDPMSIQYLTGAEIDYVENLQGAHFIVRNPNAQTTCGCGSSFSI